MRSVVLALLAFSSLVACSVADPAAGGDADEAAKLARKARKKEMMRQMAAEVNAAINHRKDDAQLWDQRYVQFK